MTEALVQTVVGPGQAAVEATEAVAESVCAVPPLVLAGARSSHSFVVWSLQVAGQRFVSS